MTGNSSHEGQLAVDFARNEWTLFGTKDRRRNCTIVLHNRPKGIMESLKHHKKSSKIHQLWKLTVILGRHYKGLN